VNYTSDTYLPDFDEKEFDIALSEFEKREKVWEICNYRKYKLFGSSLLGVR